MVKYNHTQIDAHLAVASTATDTLAALATDINATKTQLLADYIGASARGYEGEMNFLNRSYDEFVRQLGRTRVAIQQASDDMHQTDVRLGALYPHQA